MADAISVAPDHYPDHYKVLEENDRVRILEYRSGPGAKTAMHSHPAVVAVPVTNANVRFTLANNQTMEISLSAGQAMYMDAADHATEVLGTSGAHVIIIELK